MPSPLPISVPGNTQPSKLAGSSPASPAALPSPFRPRANKKMSIAQTYFLAHKARAKLSSEAARPDHNLRLLVGHANLLDSLMLELADAEREQESWFNQSVRGASHTSSEERRIQWADTIVEEPEQDWRREDAESVSDSDSDSDSDFDDDEDIEMADAVPLSRIPSHTMLPHKAAYPPSVAEEEDEDDGMDEDEEEDLAELALRRTPSNSASSSSPPELEDDSDDSIEDESMPPSPPTPLIPTFEGSQKESTDTPTTIDQGDKAAFYEEGYYLPPRNQARLISAISVY
ncbi:hypothetical protein MYCTH_111645 [Thermothelomyces thermophilus ATCC 42464]|uniref:Protein ECM13 n=1 Tax=Thermothelomyces thermophilus (strain ATCC 42464 / BCRC 31852 / DSM 1799) TaxID=573729 RepID=G2QDJ5_THET4|nr:uncharacterized protein MYCTH_111645 [Thermothelomyces thermophilus ATCC 42464]AEO57507.1 hypothetical protein MYCTH_111645 [Thermothelomyces thermophilus ATCC 42464]